MPDTDVASHAIPSDRNGSVRSEGGRSQQEALYLQSYALKCSRWAERLASSHAHRSSSNPSQVTFADHPDNRQPPAPRSRGTLQSSHHSQRHTPARPKRNMYAYPARIPGSHAVHVSSTTSLPSRDMYGCHECPVCSSLSSIMSQSIMAPPSLKVDDQDTSETPQGGKDVPAVPEDLRVSQSRVLSDLGMLGVPPPTSKESGLDVVGPQASFGSVDDGPSSAQIAAAVHGPDVAFDDDQTKLVRQAEPQPDNSKADVVLLEVSGMTCGSCSANVKSILEGHPTVKTASVNLTTGTALVHVRVPDKATSGGKSSQLLQKMGEDLAEMVSECGFDTVMRDVDAPINETTAKELTKRTERQHKLRWATYTLILAWFLTAIALTGHLLHQWKGLDEGPWPLRVIAHPICQATLSIFTLLFPARGILIDGAKALYHRRPDMNVLVALGALSGLVVSFVAYFVSGLGWTPFFAEPAMLLSVVLLGRSLEERAKLQASSDMAALYQLLPVTARLVVAGSDDTKEVPAEAVVVGDLIMVLPGDRVPVDGVVESGRTTVNEAAVTGEPMPVTKMIGSVVAAGTSNVDGVIKVRSEAAGGNTTIAGIVKSVEEAQARTTPVQKMADIVAGKFAICVIMASLLTIMFWALAGPWVFPEAVNKAAKSAINRASHGAGHGSDDVGMDHNSSSPPGSNGRKISTQWLLLAVQLGLSVLVVACPCALGLATPTAVLVGSSVAAKRGLLVRGGDILESMTHITHVVFDKTGTLTEGKPSVADVKFCSTAGAGSTRRWSEQAAAGATSEDEMLALAAAVEEASMHPLAKAVVAERDQRSLPKRLLEDGSLLQEPGSGISGVVEGHEVAVGNEGWMETATGAAMPRSSLSALPAGATRIFVAVDGEFCGHLDLVDELRPTVVATLNALHDSGLRTMMLTGDMKATAISIGATCGMRPEDIFAGVKPEGKLEKIRSLQAGGAKVAMVGDGINDTSALAQADVGIAMSGGVQAAGDVANVVLLRDCPSQVADAFRIARVILNKIRQNLVWAFGYNLVAIPVAAGALLPPFGVMLSPTVSAALMAGSSLAVMGNSLLLRRETHRKNSVSESAAPAAAKDTAVAMWTELSAEPKRKRHSRKHRTGASPTRNSETLFRSALYHSSDTVLEPEAAGKRPGAVKSYSSKNATPILPYRQAPRSEHPQEAPRPAAPMRQGYRSSSAMPRNGGLRHVDVQPGDIRTMLVGQDRTGRRMH